MKKCLYENCSNAENTPGVEFHEVFDSSEGNKSLELYVCSHHLQREVNKQSEPARQTHDKPEEEAGVKKRAESSVQKPGGSSEQKSTEDGGQGGPEATKKPRGGIKCCKAKNCTVSSSGNPQEALHAFPNDRSRFLIWCNIAEYENDGIHLGFSLCHRHFKASSYLDVRTRKKLIRGSNPVYRTGVLNPITGDYCPASSSTASAATEGTQAEADTGGTGRGAEVHSQVHGQIELRDSQLPSVKMEVEDSPNVCQLATGANNQDGSSVFELPSSSVRKSIENGATTERPKKNRHCCAAGCNVSLFTHPDVGLFKFYPSQKRFEKWCLIADLPIRETRLAFCLCARHFQKDCFVDDERRNLKASSDPIYPTGSLNEITGNYCPRIYSSKEPPLIEADSSKPVEVIYIDDEPTEKSSKNPESKKPQELQPGTQPLTDEPQSADHGYAMPKSTKNDTTVESSEGSLEVKYCCHRDCNNISTENGNVRFFRLPVDPDPRTDFWFKVSGLHRGMRGKLHRHKYWLCSEHFDSSQFQNESTLIPTALPKSDGVSQLPLPKQLRMDKFLKCDAAGCPSSYKDDPTIKFFTLRNKMPELFNEWKDMIGGLVTKNRSTSGLARFTICQYHFPEKAFTDGHFRSRLFRIKELRLFPFGPINPKTGDYCPEGQEELSIIYHKERILACCVRGCHNMKPLYKFPYYDDRIFDIWCERTRSMQAAV